jgi:hypothetical protein
VLRSSSPRTRPGPVFRPLHQSRNHGIPLNILPDALKFGLVSHPVVIGFVLPEGLTNAPQSSIRVARGDSFDAARDSSQRRSGQEEYVYVIRHHHLGVERVLTELFTTKDGVLREHRNLGVAKPDGAKSCAVERGVEVTKFLAVSSTGTLACVFLSFQDTARRGGPTRWGCATRQGPE